MTIERYIAPQTLEEAAGILSQGGVTILAGGTDLMVQTHAGRVKFRPVLMNIRRVAELQGISLHDGAVRIGALATITDLLTNPIVREKLPVLTEMADHFASDQIRNAGTVGGSLCNASPAGDVAPPLLVLDAEVELVSKPNGAMRMRTLPIAEFFTGPGRTRSEPNELLAAVRVPLPREGYTAQFLKFGTRPALDIATIAIAIGGVKKGRALHAVRVALGAVAPVPMRAVRTEAAVEGRDLDAAAIEAAAATARDEAKPISDVRATAWYRQPLQRRAALVYHGGVNVARVARTRSFSPGPMPLAVGMPIILPVRTTKSVWISAGPVVGMELRVTAHRHFEVSGGARLFTLDIEGARGVNIRASAGANWRF